MVPTALMVFKPLQSDSSRTLARFLNSLFLIALAVLFIASGARGLYLNAGWADVVGAARSLELGAAKPSAGLLRLVDELASAENSSSKHPSCVEGISRSWMTLWLSKWDRYQGDRTSEQGRALGASALDAVNEHLRCFPTDGNAWLWRGKILARDEGPTVQSASAFEISYWTAPAERWIMIHRFVAMVPYLDQQQFLRLKPMFEADLGRIVSGLSPAEIAEVYVGSAKAIRTTLLDHMARLPARTQKAVVGEVDKLGLTIRLPAGPGSP